jgi:RNA methyltransferase, TrmH family
MQPASNHAHVRIVQSRQNARVKELRAALHKAEKTGSGLIALEGFHLVEEALRSHLRIATLFVRSGSLSLADNLPLQSQTEVLELPPEIFASAVTTESPQPIAALAEAPSFSLETILAHPNPLILISAGLQDPGNLGTIIRSAEAFAATGLIALPGTVSLWNPKTLRASSGSAFRLPIVQASSKDIFPALQSRGIRTTATSVDRGTPAQRFDLTQPIALFIGNEGSGLSTELASYCDKCITIPTPSPVESLNAAIATSILLYEAARQRSIHPARESSDPEQREGSALF